MDTWGNGPRPGSNFGGQALPPAPPGPPAPSALPGAPAPPAWTPTYGPGGPTAAPPPPGPVGYGWYAPKPAGTNTGLVVGIVVAVFVGMVGIATMVGIGGTFGSVFSATTLPDLEVGQCFNGARPDPRSTGLKIVDSVDVVPCSEPHDSELVASFQYPAAANAKFPGDDEVSDYADSECSTWFYGYVGIPAEQTDYGLTYFVPLESNWVADDRSVQCVVNPPHGQALMTGSVRNTKR